MNRRGQLERAISAARISPAAYALFTQLLRRVGNDTGEIDDDKWTPKLATVIAQAKLSRASGYRALAELERHAWLKRYETDNRAKIAGHLMPGRDCDCGGVAVCKHCGGPLGNRRSVARWCSDRCRKAARRQSQKPGQPVSVTRTNEPAASLSYPDMSGMQAGHVRDASRTASLSYPDNPQVTGSQNDVPHIESRDEGGEREPGCETETERSAMDGNGREPVCGECGAPVSALRFAQTRGKPGGVVCVRCEPLPRQDSAAVREGRDPWGADW